MCAWNASSAGQVGGGEIGWQRRAVAGVTYADFSTTRTRSSQRWSGRSKPDLCGALESRQARRSSAAAFCSRMSRAAATRWFASCCGSELSRAVFFRSGLAVLVDLRSPGQDVSHEPSNQPPTIHRHYPRPWAAGGWGFCLCRRVTHDRPPITADQKTSGTTRNTRMLLQAGCVRVS